MNEQVSKIINHPARIPVGVGVVSFAAGVGTGLLISYIRNRRWIEIHQVPRAVDFDHEAMERFISQREEEAGIERPEPETEEKVSAGEQFVREKIETMTTVETPDETAEKPVDRSIFAHTDEEWDYEEELKSRSSAEPYILHKDEFYANELDYTQTTLTFYSGDDIMADEEDSPVYNYHLITGELKFGHGSGDPNVVYIRNDKRRAEYEVLYDSGLFSVEILGLSIEDNARVKGLKHSNDPVRRFRTD